MLKKTLAGTLTVLLIAAGAVFGLAAPASAHTGDMSHSAVCNTATGQYDVTTTLQTANTPGGLVGAVKAHIGGDSISQWGEGDFPWEIPVTSTLAPNASVSFSYSIPGTSVNGPWVYTWTEWSNSVPQVTFEFGSDGRVENLGGNCVAIQDAKVDWGLTPPTCTTGQTLTIGDNNLVGAVWTAGALAMNGTVGPADLYPEATLLPGYKWADGQNGTFHVVLSGPLTEVDCVASASVTLTDATCFAPGTVVPLTMVNALFGEPQIDDTGHYTIVANATGLATFAPGPGVTNNNTVMTFTGQVNPQITENCVATAEIKKHPGTCTEYGWIEVGAIGNAEWGEITYDYVAGTYSVTAIATGYALFASGDGVSQDGTQKTFTGPIPPTDPEDCKIDGPKKPWVKDEKCVEGKPSNGSIEVKFGELGDKIKFEITGVTLDETITIEYADLHKVSLPGGSYTVTAIAVEPWMFKDGATTMWYVTIDDAKCKVYPDPALWQGEICVDGETEQGWIAVDYSGYLPQQIQYRITGSNGFDEAVIPEGDLTYFYLDAGTYTVTVEPLFDWVKVKGDNFPVEITITSATNCVCFVPDQADNEKLSILADIAPVCSEAEVSITPPTCAESGKLVLGEVVDATWGEPIIIDGHYEVTATASGGYRFAPGDGVSDDGFTKVFEGDLPAATGNCGQLTTLSLTGGSGGNLPWVAGLALLLGIGGVFVAYRRPKTRVIES